jgi:hypothetical protein
VISPSHPEQKNKAVDENIKSVCMIELCPAPGMSIEDRQSNHSQHVQELDQENTGWDVPKLFFPWALIGDDEPGENREQCHAVAIVTDPESACSIHAYKTLITRKNIVTQKLQQELADLNSHIDNEKIGVMGRLNYKTVEQDPAQIKAEEQY